MTSMSSPSTVCLAPSSMTEMMDRLLIPLQMMVAMQASVLMWVGSTYLYYYLQVLVRRLAVVIHKRRYGQAQATDGSESSREASPVEPSPTIQSSPTRVTGTRRRLQRQESQDDDRQK